MRAPPPRADGPADAQQGAGRGAHLPSGWIAVRVPVLAVVYGRQHTRGQSIASSNGADMAGGRLQRFAICGHKGLTLAARTAGGGPPSLYAGPRPLEAGALECRMQNAVR